ncbi:Tad domain-containing protein [Hellea sp.]|nr:Tad domain-containing protein [Hellea sp.]
MTRFSKFKNSEDGNIAVIFAVTAFALVLALGTTLDIGLLHTEKAKMQDATDNAALTAARIMSSQTSLEKGPREEEAKRDAEYGFSVNFQSNVVSPTTPSINFDNSSVTVSAEGKAHLNFGKVFGRETVNVRASAVSAYGENEPTPSAPCIMALSTSASPGVTVNSGAKINAPTCEIHVHSTRNPAFIVNSGVTFDFSKVCIAGDRIIDNNSGVDNIETSCDVAEDPYAGNIPVPDSSSCDYSNGNYSASQITLYPGVYCGWHNFNSNRSDVHFEPGLYILKNGGWNVNGGNWSGTGVTFYYADNSKIQFNSGVSADFTAPDSGDYKDIFMAETASSNRSQFIFNDSKGFIFEGVIYLPNRQFIMNSGSDTRGRTLGIIADTFMFNSIKLNIDGGVSSNDQASSGGVVSTELRLAQ